MSSWDRTGGARWENPRGSYEASGRPERSSTLERGSSTTKICQAVPTREYHSDQPSLNAAPALSQRLTGKNVMKK